MDLKYIGLQSVAQLSIKTRADVRAEILIFSGVGGGRVVREFVSTQCSLCMSQLSQLRVDFFLLMRVIEKQSFYLLPYSTSLVALPTVGAVEEKGEKLSTPSSEETLEESLENAES